ncbi:hypothetical protein LWI28_011767 [Acer negundo]|uniref:Uncharacterized protein n=1 Tax=Acer negundo TaxID=4023 RepID=A0AAD5J527_ACENE|nr:hypothetical protein LWI28_011767 [Acer negundo]
MGDLTMLTRLWSGYYLEFPSLKEFVIHNCPELEAFILDNKVRVPKLEKMKIYQMDNLKMICRMRYLFGTLDHKNLSENPKVESYKQMVNVIFSPVEDNFGEAVKQQATTSDYSIATTSKILSYYPKSGDRLVRSIISLDHHIKP